MWDNLVVGVHLAAVSVRALGEELVRPVDRERVVVRELVVRMGGEVVVADRPVCLHRLIGAPFKGHGRPFRTAPYLFGSHSQDSACSQHCFVSHGRASISATTCLNFAVSAGSCF